MTSEQGRRQNVTIVTHNGWARHLAVEEGNMALATVAWFLVSWARFCSVSVADCGSVSNSVLQHAFLEKSVSRTSSHA